MLKRMASACAFAVLALMTSRTANAEAIDRRTFFTFNQPVALPGVTLPAGTYIFRILDTDSGRRVVQVLSADGNRSCAILTSVPVERRAAPDRPEIEFMETAAGMPAAVRTWWLAGVPRGYGFVYPREQALKLAQGVGGDTPDPSRVAGTGAPPATDEQPAAPAATSATQG